MATRKTLKHKADKLWKERIHERDRGVCQYCGRGGGNAHHIVGRRNYRVRHDIDNGIYLCPSCHIFRTDSAHQDPLGFIDWFSKKYPERYKYLMKAKNELWDKDYDRILKELEDETTN